MLTYFSIFRFIRRHYIQLHLFIQEIAFIETFRAIRISGVKEDLVEN